MAKRIKQFRSVVLKHFWLENKTAIVIVFLFAVWLAWAIAGRICDIGGIGK